MTRTRQTARGGWRYHVCGCYVFNSETNNRTYLPQVKLDAHTTILSTASRTVLKQTFANSGKALDEIRYAFPLFDGVSVVDFVCQIGDRTIYGLVKEKGEARKTYEEAKERGESGALLEQLPEAADVFTTSISKVPENSTVHVTITYIQELNHDSEVDGIRLTIPTSIAPRYGSYPGQLQDLTAVQSKSISLMVDISMGGGAPITKVISPSHPIEVSLGSLSTSTIDEDYSPSKASATLVLGTSELEMDFVLQVVAKDVGVPQAILETHPTLPNQRALMTTLVPRFNLKSQKPELIFIADRSGSMDGCIPTLSAALRVFLKSIPVGCMFNICSFGSRYEFLWPQSQVYNQDTLTKAIKYVDAFEANFGGTDTFDAIKACVESRHKELPTELLLLTDGDIWSQQQMFDYVSEQTKSGDIRVFPVGIGTGISTSLIEGVARAGRGFAQMVGVKEKLDSKIVRMLKGALTPHIKDYQLEVKYEDDSIDSVTESLGVRLNLGSEDEKKTKDIAMGNAKPISLYDPESKEEKPTDEPQDIFAGLPKLRRPKLLQTPHEIPPLFPFNRTCVYLLMGPETSSLQPKSVVLRGTSPQGPLELEIPVENRKGSDAIIHQLAARKATQELEEGRGWIFEATDSDTGVLVNEKYPARFALIQRREAVRLGVEFQVGGKYCSFVAVEANEREIAEKRTKALNTTVNRDVQDDEDWEFVAPRASVGGVAPRMQLASKPARKSAPSNGCVKSPSKRKKADPWSTPKKRKSADKTPASGAPQSGTFESCPASVRGGGGRGGADGAPAGHGAPGRGMARGGALRHRRIYVQEEAMSDEEEEDEEAEESDEDMGFGLFDGPTPGFPATGKTHIRSDEEGPLLQRLIARQSFEGSWKGITDLLSDELGISGLTARNAINKLVDESKLARTKAEKLLSTASVIVFMETKMADDEETWELVVEKARTWLNEAVSEKVLTEVWKLAESVVGV